MFLASNTPFTIRDHLGNGRVYFTKDYNGEGSPDVLQESHYYPFGAQIEGLSRLYDAPGGVPFATNLDYVYEEEEDPTYIEYLQYTHDLKRYNGKEYNRELGLNWYDYGARWYDPVIGRWNAVDPLAEKYYSINSYVYVANNPLLLIDPNGKEVKNAYEEYAQYKGLESTLNANLEKAKKITDKKTKKKAKKQAREELSKNAYKILNYTYYEMVENLITAFAGADSKEFEKLDNLKFNDKVIDITVGLNFGSGNAVQGETNKSEGATRYRYSDIGTTTKISGNTYLQPFGINNNSINITLYSGGHDLPTLANEFGDAIFAVEQPMTKYYELNAGADYRAGKSDQFSFAYQKYITTRQSKNKAPKPNSNGYKYNFK